VVRLEGTNVELGRNILGASGLNVIAADDLDDAAQKIVKAVTETPARSTKGQRAGAAGSRASGAPSSRQR
jgi:hypothetical protein